MSAFAKTFVLAAMFGLVFTAPAFARDQVFVAKLAQPVGEATRVIANQTLWNCEADTCRAAPRHAATVRACRQLVRETGSAVVAYGPEEAPLSQEELVRCNAYAPQQPQTQQAAAN